MRYTINAVLLVLFYLILMSIWDITIEHRLKPHTIKYTYIPKPDFTIDNEGYHWIIAVTNPSKLLIDTYKFKDNDKLLQWIYVKDSYNNNLNSYINKHRLKRPIYDKINEIEDTASTIIPTNTIKTIYLSEFTIDNNDIYEYGPYLVDTSKKYNTTAYLISYYISNNITSWYSFIGTLFKGPYYYFNSHTIVYTIANYIALSISFINIIVGLFLSCRRKIKTQVPVKVIDQQLLDELNKKLTEIAEKSYNDNILISDDVFYLYKHTTGIPIPIHGRIHFNSPTWKVLQDFCTRRSGGIKRCCEISRNCRGHIHLHHKIPISKGGTNLPSNLEFRCETHHWQMHPHKIAELIDRTRVYNNNVITVYG